jgi:hypothetical protein
MANRIAKTYRFDRVDVAIAFVVLIALAGCILGACGYRWGTLVAGYLGGLLILFYFGLSAALVIRDRRRG